LPEGDPNGSTLPDHHQRSGRLEKNGKNAGFELNKTSARIPIANPPNVQQPESAKSWSSFNQRPHALAGYLQLDLMGNLPLLPVDQDAINWPWQISCKIPLKPCRG